MRQFFGHPQEKLLEELDRCSSKSTSFIAIFRKDHTLLFL